MPSVDLDVVVLAGASSSSAGWTVVSRLCFKCSFYISRTWTGSPLISFFAKLWITPMALPSRFFGASSSLGGGTGWGLGPTCMNSFFITVVSCSCFQASYEGGSRALEPGVCGSLLWDGLAMGGCPAMFSPLGGEPPFSCPSLVGRPGRPQGGGGVAGGGSAGSVYGGLGGPFPLPARWSTCWRHLFFQLIWPWECFFFHHF